MNRRLTRAFVLLIVFACVAILFMAVRRPNPDQPANLEDVAAPAPGAPYRDVSKAPVSVEYGRDQASSNRPPTASKRSPLPPVRAVSVKFSGGATRSQKEDILGRHGFRLLEDIAPIGWVSAEPVDVKADLSGLLVAIGDDPRVSTAERQSRIYADLLPDDPYFGTQWGYYNDGSLTGSVAGCDAKISSAWDWSRGSGTVIAVIDTGIDFSHPDLAGKMHPASWDYVYDDATVFHPTDGDKHGTHVAGTAAASTNNAVGVAGTAFDGQIMALKTLGPWDSGLIADGAAAIVRAVDNGADVINCSWGTTTYSQALADAVQYAASRGVLVVASAGNSTKNTDLNPAYPASLPSTNVISVASTTYTDGLSSFSNYGATTVDLGAPGQWIVSTQPVHEAGLLVDTGTYKMVYFAFPFESLPTAGDRREVAARSMSTLGAAANSPVLVVDDSWPGYVGEAAGARLSRYTTALQDAGYTNVSTWSVQSSGAPTLASMSGKYVIWFTGWATLRWGSAAMAFSTADRSVVASFLAGGGRMMVSSSDAGYDCNWVGGTAKTFYETYFHASFCGDDSWTPDFIGRSGGLLSGMMFAINDQPQFDAVLPRDAAATSIGYWREYGEISGTSMSSPHVTGTLALMYSRLPSLTATAAKQRLLDTADTVPSLAGKCLTGARLDASEAVGKIPAPVPLQVGPAGPGSQVLYWRKPADSDLAAVRLLSRTDTYPVGPDDPSATVLYEGLSEAATSTGLSVGSIIHYAAYARNEWNSWSEAATVATTVVDPPAGGVPVPVGTDVTVECEGVTASWAEVSTPGWLSITRVPPSIVPPVNFLWVPDGYYEIHPVGEVPLPVDLTIPYDPETVAGDPGGLRFFHRSGEAWEDVTVQVDPTRHVVLARTDSFSEFGLGGPAGSGEPVTVPLETPLQGVIFALVLAAGLAMAKRGEREIS